MKAAIHMNKLASRLSGAGPVIMIPAALLLASFVASHTATSDSLISKIQSAL